jgi:chromosome segregation ATPase
VEALTLQSAAKANPIRKVVTILQDMQKEIEAEGEAEKKMFDKFMCYCEGNTDGMSKSAEEAGQRITELKSKLEAEKAEKSQLDQELIQHKTDRESAKADLETATTLREKEHAEFSESTGEQKADLDAMTGALAALEKGMGSSFLQANTQRLTRVVQAAQTVDDYQREMILNLLQGQNPFGDYSARSGEIVGILKAMKDEMDKDLGGAIKDEEAAAKGFDAMKAAKNDEIEAASAAIEAKTVRSGELAVSVTTTADDIEDTTKEMAETEAFLADLASSCKTKKAEWAERSQMRSEEVAAISEAIKVLNDDDALDLFKKTLALPQENMRFLQKTSESSSRVLRARAFVHNLRKKGGAHAQELALIEFSLKSKAVDFSKVLEMIDGMVGVLGKEQADDDAQKGFCEKDLAKSEKEKADTESAIASSEAAIEEMTAGSESLAEEIAALQAEVKALDKAVAEATEQRKEEHAEFLTFQTENNAAVQLVEKAKNHLYKFYRPNLHKEAPKKELTDEEKLLAASGASDMIATDAPVMIAGTTQTVFVQLKDDAAPPPPPETWGAYQKKDGKSNGVIALMDMLIKDLQDGIVNSKHEEETAQKDYERLMAESQTTREQSVESITSKEAAKADLDTKIEATKEAKSGQEAELSNIKNTIAQLHANCDFLLENYDLRKTARANEVESLKNAKSVLSGASFA